MDRRRDEDDCNICSQALYESKGDLVYAGEEAYASIRRATNGGGKNSPMLEKWAETI